MDQSTLWTRVPSLSQRSTSRRLPSKPSGWNITTLVPAWTRYATSISSGSPFVDVREADLAEVHRLGPQSPHHLVDRDLLVRRFDHRPAQAFGVPGAGARDPVRGAVTPARPDRHPRRDRARRRASALARRAGLAGRYARGADRSRESRRGHR